jgi:hypothetical protein
MCPRVVVALELREKLDEQTGAVDGCPGLEAEGRSRCVHLSRKLILAQIYVDPNAEHDATVARLGQDPGHLPPPDQKVVREPNLRPDSGLSGDRVSRGTPRDDRQLREARHVELGAKVDRDEDARPGWGVPGSPEPASSRRLLLRDRDGAFGDLRRKLPLGRFATLEVEVRTAEPTSEQRLDVRRGKGVITHYTHRIVLPDT